MRGAQAVDGAGEVAHHPARFGGRAHGPQLQAQRVAGGGQFFPGGRVLRVFCDPRLQRFGAFTQGRRLAARRRALQVHHRLRAQQHRWPFGGVAAQGVQGLKRSRRLAAGHSQLRLQQHHRALSQWVTRCGRGDQGQGLGGAALSACRVAQQRRGQRATVQRGHAVGQQRRRGAAAEALQRLRAVVHQHACAHLHQCVLHGGWRHHAAAQQRAVARFGNAVHRQRVAAQVREAAVVIEARGDVELFKHRGHAGWRIAGVCQHAVADAVGFAFDVARKVQLALDGRRLPAHDGGVGGVDVAAAAGREDAEQEGRNRDHRSPLLRRDAARDVALRDVRELVRQHRSQLVASACQRHQPQVHANVAARQRKGVHAAVAHQEGFPGEGLVGFCIDVAARAGGGHQRVPQLLQVFQQHGVVQILRVTPAFAHDLFAQALFSANAQVVRGRFAQSRQAHLRVAWGAEGDGCAEQGGQQAAPEMWVHARQSSLWLLAGPVGA